MTDRGYFKDGRRGTYLPGSYLPSRYAGRAPSFPLSSGAASNLLRVTLTSLYGFAEATGNLTDLVGSSHLTAAGTPTYRRLTRAGRIGIYYDASGDKHSADVNALAAASGWYATVFEVVAPVASSCIMSRHTAGGLSDGASLWMQSGTTGTMLVRDSGANSRIVNTTMTLTVGSLVLGQLQIDRAANTARARFSIFGGAAEQITGDITGFATLDGASMEFGFGSITALTEGIANCWAATAHGVQCEGASFLANNAIALGFE